MKVGKLGLFFGVNFVDFCEILGDFWSFWFDLVEFMGNLGDFWKKCR